MHWKSKLKQDGQPRIWIDFRFESFKNVSPKIMTSILKKLNHDFGQWRIIAKQFSNSELKSNYFLYSFQLWLQRKASSHHHLYHQKKSVKSDAGSATKISLWIIGIFCQEIQSVENGKHLDSPVINIHHNWQQIHAEKANTFDLCRQAFSCSNFSLRLMQLGVEGCTHNKCRRRRRRWRRWRSREKGGRSVCWILWDLHESTASTRDARSPEILGFKWCRTLWNFVSLTSHFL